MPATTERPMARHQRPVMRAYDSVLESKITVPGPHKWAISRQRITTLIATGARGPLTVVTGPPGAGKSMALACWAASRPWPGPIAWVTLDVFDNRPETFWSHVTEALRRAGAAISAELPALATKQPEVFLRQLALAMAAQDPAVSLVLDDFHLLTEPRSLEGLGYMLRNASTGLHLLLASRTDPVLPLHRYRLTGELTEIRAEDLAFSVSEADLLLAQHGITLAPELLATLTRRGEGWAAGLRLAALSMDGHPDPEQFVKELAAEDGAIAGYLVEEVLNAQPPPVRDLLLKTSILDRVSVGLAGELARNGKVGDAIPALAQANAFVQAIGNGWYRYHPLFADVLRRKLRHEAPYEVAQLHRRAARWLRRHGTLREAVSQAAAARDWKLAARMTVGELAVGTLLDPQAGEPLADALAQMPADPAPRDAASLAVAAAMALRRGHDDACLTRLDRTERLLGRPPPDAEIPSRLAVALIRMALAQRRGDLEAATAAAAHTGSMIAGLPAGLLARHPEARLQELSSRGAVEIWAGRPDDAADTLRPCADVGSWDCAGNYALAAVLRGRLSDAEGLAAAVCAPRGNGRAGNACHPGAAAEVALAWLHLERHQLSEAAGRLSRAENALRAHPDRLLGALAWLAAARLNLAGGRPGPAAEMIDRARRGWSAPPWLEQRLALVDACARAAAGDFRAALGAAGRAGPASALPGAVALTRARLAAGEPVAAARALAGVSPAAPGETPEYLRLEACLAEAELCYGNGDASRGRRSLQQALKLAKKERVLLPFTIQRAWIEPVLRSDPALAAAFRRLFQPADAMTGRSQARSLAQAPGSGQGAPVLVERLSGRELEVLRHVSRMLSTMEIAGEMHLSADTVKSHLKSIFRKLGVTRRREAVRRAQQLALF